MDKLKIENFSKAHRGIDFPRCVPLDDVGTMRIRSSLTEKLGLEHLSDSLLLVRKLDSLQFLCEGVDASEDGFSLRNAFTRIGIPIPTDVFINWYRFDSIDCVAFDDFDRYFDDFWYPSSDDIDVFDASLTWVISVAHDGRVKVLKLVGWADAGSPTSQRR